MLVTPANETRRVLLFVYLKRGNCMVAKVLVNIEEIGRDFLNETWKEKVRLLKLFIQRGIKLRVTVGQTLESKYSKV